MRRFFLLIILGFCLSFSTKAQLVQWQLTVDGQPTVNNPQLFAGDFSGGALVSVTYGSTGAYASGWPTATATVDDYYQIVVAPDTGYKLTITDLNFSERRSLSGIHDYEVRYSTDSAFASYSVLATVTVPDDDAERDGSITGLNLFVNSGDTLYIRWYGYNAESSAGTWRINDNSLSINGTLSVANANDVNSAVFPPATQIVAGTISSLAVTQNDAVPVFSFDIKDQGTGDGKPTFVTYLTIANSHPVGEADWSSHIQGAVLNDGTQNITVSNFTIDDNQMTFLIDSGNLVVPDGGVLTMTLLVYLNAGGLTDNGVLQFQIDSVNQGFDAILGGSGFASVFGQTVVSNPFTVDVQATKLIFSDVPYIVWQSADFQSQVEATDIYQNKDLDNVSAITMSQVNGSGNLSSLTGLSQLLIQGQFQWTDLQYDGTDNFQLKVSDNAGTLIDAYSSTIYVSQAYDTISDNFSDGDITVNPAWMGNTAAFITSSATNHELELFTYTGSSDTAYLVTPFNNQYDSVEWQMKVHLAFDPSDNNFARFYLMADNNDLKASSNAGFYLQFGENGTADAIALYHQTSLGNTELICRGTDATIAISPEVRVKVIYTKATHQWRLYADHTGQSNFLQEATGTDTVSSGLPPAHYIGIFTRYTTTNDEGKMFFDDVYAGPVQIDTIPPALSLVRVVDSLHLDVIFSEGIMSGDAGNKNNYSINNGVGMPISAQQDSVDISLVHLALTTPLVDEMTYQMTVTQVKDFSGNTGSNLSANFTYYLPKFNDIVVNEIMADPSPAVGLPEYEYVELFNNVAYDIDITNWTITVGTKTKSFSDLVIPADSFLIVTSDDGLLSFSAYGNA
ncbi:MAG: lamin tail domain-containing protein, partial [Bacteroidales bacterium]|nr:lamin tail domain-containing protein [Bacteroidales bacterium]